MTTTVQGRERYGVSVRLQRDFRNELSDLERLPVSVGDGRRQIPLGEPGPPPDGKRPGHDQK